MALSEKEIRRRHTASHVMTAAVKMLFPEVKLGVGPWTDEGFYQDFDFGDYKLTEKDLKKIEKKMRWIVNKNFPIVRKEVGYEEAKQIFAHDPYKLELIEDLKKEGEKVFSFYDFGEGEKPFYRDLCAGPHLNSTGELGVFKLTRIAGAYWRGDEHRPMLTRIYGVAFEDEAALKRYEEQQKEAQKRDHRKLGKLLQLFTFDEEIGPGLPLWMPKGAVIVEELERLAKETEASFGYERVRTPHIAKEALYLRSGHLPYYQEDMFPPMELDNTKYYLKAMNCPHHHKIYAAVPRSYRDLPLRLAEYGHCYRYEDSGALFGLMRVRSLCMNDAHIYCTEEQFEEEFKKVLAMYLFYFELFGIKKYQMRLSKHAPEKLGKKYVNEPELWKQTEAQVRRVLEKLKVPFVEAEDEAAFYGPKIDVQIWSVIGREFTLATNQLDFAVPKRFNLTYQDKDGKEKTPICIHRAPLSTHERFIGFLIEHYAGAFPGWLAPIQVAVLPVSKVHEEAAKAISEDWRKRGIRVQFLDTSQSLAKRIRYAQTQKIPYTAIFGDKELAEGFLTLRPYGKDEDIQAKESELFAWLKRPKISAEKIASLLEETA